MEILATIGVIAIVLFVWYIIGLIAIKLRIAKITGPLKMFLLIGPLGFLTLFTLMFMAE